MRRRRRGTPREFLWPFILMIGVGLIFVLIVQLVMSFFSQKEAEMRNKANFYIDKGSAQIMEWGDDEWMKAYDGGVVLEGDAITTKAASKGVLVMFNGTEVRFSENTEVSVSTLDTKGDEDVLVLNLRKGEIWVDQIVSEKGTMNITVEVDNMNVYSTGTEFAVEERELQSVRVVEGNVMVELVEREKSNATVIDDVKVGVGQQIEMSESDVADLLARRNMDFLEALDSDWKEGEFYEWNYAYESPDREPVVVEEPEEEEEELISNPQSPEQEEEPVEEEEEDFEDPVLTLTNPETSPSVYEGEQIYILGTVDGFASKIVVTSYTEEGTAEDYKLNLFNAGDTDWSYNAAIIYGNLHEGENEFFVKAYDFDGNEADELHVVINIPEGTAEEEVEEETEEEEVEEVEPLACGEITAPVVTHIDHEEWDGEVFELTEDAVRIEGTVDCAYGIVINGYQLTLFEPGDTDWAYVTSLEYNNLYEGETVYEVYAVDEAGNRSDSAYFTINYVPEAE